MGNACCDTREGGVDAKFAQCSTVMNDSDSLYPVPSKNNRSDICLPFDDIAVKELEESSYVCRESGVACLAWMVSTHSVVHRPELQQLHHHIGSCVDLVDGDVLVTEATFGIVRGRCREDSGVKGADAMLRLGQLLCRMAITMNIGLQVGLHVGDIESLRIPDFVNRCQKSTEQPAEKTSFFGPACTVAMHLARESAHEGMVHLSVQAKEALDIFHSVRLTISQTQDQVSYYLDPKTIVKKYSHDWSAQHHDDDLFEDIFLDVSQSVNVKGVQRMTLADFESFLRRQSVDVTKFGQGVAKTLQEFYDSIVTERKSRLEFKDGVLWRVVDLVRISLRIRDKDNRLRELRIASQCTRAGGVRIRDQPLAFVLKSADSCRWGEAVTKCFEEKLQLSASVQNACFATDEESYCVTEDRSKSETIPGIPTIYKAHNIVINVKDKNKQELYVIGLPGGDAFTMGSGSSQKTWTWGIVGDSKEEELFNLLQKHGVDATEFEPRAFAELYEEVYDLKQSSLEVANKVLLRRIAIVKVWLHAQVLNVDHVLSVKTKWQKGKFDATCKDQPISMRMGCEQDWEEAVEQALLTRLNITTAFYRQYISVDLTSHEITEELGYSKSYPGLKTLYVVNEVSCHVLDSNVPGAEALGLPTGTDFTFSRSEPKKGPENDDVVVTHWCWRHVLGFEEQKRLSVRQSFAHTPSLNDDPDNFISPDWIFRRRAPKPKPLKLMTREAGPAGQLAALMRGRRTNWNRARNAAKRIRDPKYLCKNFHDDVTMAFPELRLYYILQDGEVEQELTSSGRTADDEYQRTIGSLFAVYWLMRVDMDGKESFSYGLDAKWEPRRGESKWWSENTDRDVEELQQRQAFYDDMNWRAIENVLIDAGLLRYESGSLCHDEQRTLTMLVMMAIHDIMKVSPLIPCVAQSIPDFCGYKAHDRICDHDTALAYIMIHHPDMLPSFSGLTESQKNDIRFVHCKMEYNMGWLVQAEAPPGSLFTKFREVIRSGQATDRDVAFYFVHWFVDLAAAEPCPLEGCEKFVLNFPQSILTRFLNSFSIVQTLAHKTQTEVLEEYLKESWKNHAPPLGTVPRGQGAVAKMRLILMAQDNSVDVLRAFPKIPLEDQVALSHEMACTGCKDQQFVVDDLSGAPPRGRGPAILIYYSPALLQKNGQKDPRGALIILAEVYRQTRVLWPLQLGARNDTVTVRIDILKELDCDLVIRPTNGKFFFVCKTSSKDAVVKCLAASDVQSLDWSSSRMLTFRKRSRPTLITAMGDLAKRFSSYLE